MLSRRWGTARCWGDDSVHTITSLPVQRRLRITQLSRHRRTGRHSYKGFTIVLTTWARHLWTLNKHRIMGALTVPWSCSIPLVRWHSYGWQAMLLVVCESCQCTLYKEQFRSLLQLGCVSTATNTQQWHQYSFGVVSNTRCTLPAVEILVTYKLEIKMVDKCNWLPIDWISSYQTIFRKAAKVDEIVDQCTEATLNKAEETIQQFSSMSCKTKWCGNS